MKQSLLNTNINFKIVTMKTMKILPTSVLSVYRI